MKLLSWNIQWGRGADGETTLQRTVSAIRTLGDFDVICLQEVAVGFAGLQGGQAVNGVAVLAAAFPGYSAHFAEGVDMPDGREGGACSATSPCRACRWGRFSGTACRGHPKKGCRACRGCAWR